MHAPRCYRCGASLEKLSLPLSRRDQCPQCGVDLHVCCMCVSFAPQLTDQCAEDDAADVREKGQANFCDYFKPSATAYAPGRMRGHDQARTELAALFGSADDVSGSTGAESPSTDDKALARAEDLFKP